MSLRSDIPMEVAIRLHRTEWAGIISTNSDRSILVRLSAALVHPGPPSASRSHQHELDVRVLR